MDKHDKDSFIFNEASLIGKICYIFGFSNLLLTIFNFVLAIPFFIYISFFYPTNFVLDFLGKFAMSSIVPIIFLSHLYKAQKHSNSNKIFNPKVNNVIFKWGILCLVIFLIFFSLFVFFLYFGQ
jgi:hypothetical protein